MKPGAQGVVDKERAVEAFAETEQLLQHLDRLQYAEEPGDGPEDAGGFASRDEIGRRRVAKETAVARVAGAQIGLESRDLPLEGRQGCRRERLFETEAKIVQQVAGLEIVAAIGHQVVLPD